MRRTQPICQPSFYNAVSFPMNVGLTMQESQNSSG